MKKMNKAIALLLALLMLLSTALFTLTSCGGDSEDNGGTSNGGTNNGGTSNGGNTTDKPGSGTTSKDETYSVTVVTKGGMAMAELPVYIYEYEDGALDELVGGAATDENGKATFTLPAGGSYAAKIDGSMPDGYDVASYYPIPNRDFTITVSSEIIPNKNNNLVGVSYELGDVMRDFTVKSKVLKENADGVPELKEEVFTLSEILKEKKAVVLNFWYTDCSWCVTEFPLMQTAYEKYQDDIAIIALDPITEDTSYDIDSFQMTMGLSFNVAPELFGLAKAFNVTGYPTSVIIDRYGVICMIEAGAITSQRAFDVVFEHFTSENYEQKLVVDYADIVPKEKPNFSMPSSGDMSAAFDKGSIDGIQYLPYPEDAKESEKEYSWPFIISDYNGETVIVPSNSGKEGSFAQIIINASLEAGEAVAFDYFSSTELGADILYVIVDGKDIYSISGESTDWKSCFAYVAEETADYQIALIYQKDTSDNVGDDTIYLKNLRIVSEEEINEPTYIFRFAATNPNTYNEYQNYVEIFYNENDGYYHVDSVDGPILLANLMGYTRFSEVDYVYNMSLGKTYEAAMTRYCNYASNSQINGVCPVTEELKTLLWEIVKDYGTTSNPNDWLKLCNYYDSYGTDEELADPIKGLALFSAYDVILSNKGDTDFPNEITYNRVIMPRGLYSKFTPQESGTYLISSYAYDESSNKFIDCEAWIFTAEGFDSKSPWYTYMNIDKNNIGKTGDLSNVYMIVYLEAGKDYYIDIAYGDVYQEGTIKFRVERLGGEGSYRFSLASPSYFTYLMDDNGGMTSTVAGNYIVPALDNDGIYREKRNDGRLGSIIYVDFEGITTIFGDKPIYSADSEVMDLIKAGAFNFAYSENDLYVLNTLNKKFHGDKDATREYLKEELGEAYNNTYADSFEGGSTEMIGFAVEEVLAGIYHGSGVDESEEILSYVDKIIKAGDGITVVNENGDGTEEYVVTEGDPRIGCVAVDAQLAELLQKVMDKYTFEDVQDSWLKLCYYEQYFCEETAK